MILLSDIVTASTTDLLNGTRLSAIPYSGATLTLQFIADNNDGTNAFDVTVQLPDGEVPVDTQRVPAQRDGKAGCLNSEDLLQMSFPAPQGGHFTIALTETGTAVCTYRIVLTP